jgi:hypothetical protein
VEVKINTVQVITATDDFASLEEATSSKYLYRFNLQISKTAAINSNATILVLRAYRENPKNAVPLSVFSQDTQVLNVLNQNSAQLVKNIQKRAFNITSKIISTRDSFIAKQPYTLKDLIARFNHGVGYTVITDDTKTAIRNEAYTAANTVDQQPLNEDRSIAQLSKELLNQYKTDPADSIKRIYAANTAYQTNNGLIGAFADKQGNVEAMIASSLMTTNNVESVFEARLQTYSVVERDVITIHPEFVFLAETIETQDFYLMFSLYDLQNNLVQEFVKLVRHKTNVTRLQRAILPPDFSITKLGGGQLSITVQQKDPHGTGVKIYKTIYNASVKTRNNVQEIVGNFDLPAGETRVFRVQNTDAGLLLFRALSYNANSDVSSDFSSQIIEVEPSEAVITKSNVYISIHPEYNREGLKVILAEIPDDIAFLELYRTNITNDPYSETLLTTFFIGGQGGNASYAYLDTVLDRYKSYRYRCVLIDIKGQRLESSGMVEFTYLPQTQDYATATATSPIVTPIQLPGSSTQYFDISFNVSYAITNKLEDNVKQFLINQGLIEYFGGDIKRERLKDLLVTKVELRDLETNDKLFMGYIDNSYLQSTTKYGPLNRSSRYIYELTTYVRNPATLLQAVELNGTSTPRTNGKLTPPTYTYVPYNVNNPYGLLTGTNPKKSGDEFVTQYGFDQLEFAEITGIDYINVDLKSPSPSINNLKANVFNSKNVDLTWSVNGDQSNISHFILRRQNVETGKLDLIGKAHGINTQNNYLFTDTIRYTDSGVFKYIITMQYFNLNLGPDYTSNEVVI